MAAPLDTTGPPGLCWQDAPTRPDTPWPRVPNPQEAAPDAGEPEWIPAAQAGDPDARAKLVNAYWDRLYRWMFHLTRDRHRAEDLTQETFLKALACAAFRVVAALREASNAVIISPGPDHWNIFERLCTGLKISGGRVSDVYHAALAIEHDCEGVSVDAGFAAFPGLCWVNPLAS